MVRSLQAKIVRLGRLGLYAGRRFHADAALDMASSLAYTSLLSLVPLLAIGLAVLAAFPVFDSVREQLQVVIFQYFVPQVGEQVRQYAGAFVENAGRLTAAGVIGLAFTAVMLLVTIETSFNRIFRVATARTATSRLVVYWTALTLGPLLLGTSFSLSSWLSLAGVWVARSGLAWLASVIGGVVAELVLILAFSLLYWAVPNRRVSPIDAGMGGLAAGLAFTVLRWGFALYVASFHVYQSIYGAVATVPIFLLWMYLSWAVVLSGAELAAALPEWRLARSDTGGPLSARRRLAIGLTILASLLEQSRRDGKGRTRRDLLAGVAEAEAPFLVVLDRLCQAGYVVIAAGGRFVLGRDLNRVSLADLVHALDLGLGQGEVEPFVEPWMEAVHSRLVEATRAESALLDLPLLGILEGAYRP